MTPEQEQFIGVLLRGMRFFGRAFLVMWLVICSVFVAAAGWMLVKAISAADSSQIGMAAGMLAASACFAGGGYVFIRFWLRSLDRMRSHANDPARARGAWAAQAGEDLRRPTVLATDEHVAPTSTCR